MYSDFYKQLNGFRGEFTKVSIANHFGVSQSNFKEISDKIIYVAERVSSETDALLKGTIFCLESKKIIRGYPKIFYGTIYQDAVDVAKKAEKELLECSELLVEKKEDGTNIRVWLDVNNKIMFSSRNEIISTDAKVMSRLFPESAKPLLEKYILVFELVMPKRGMIHYEKEDIILIDIIDTKTQKFIKRAEKEVMARNAGLNIVQTLLNERISSANFMESVLKLESLAQKYLFEGFVVKGFLDDQIFLKIKPEFIRNEIWLGGIPRARVVEAFNEAQNKLSPDELVDKTKAVGYVIKELSEDFILSVVDKKRINDYYDKEVVEFIKVKVSTEEAVKIYKTLNNISTKKDFALKILHYDRHVKAELFRLWDEEHKLKS
ncbi:MAG TPA: RNA ligase family protein [archaeon]|nr:RNA ligase family protein [archaeon]